MSKKYKVPSDVPIDKLNCPSLKLAKDKLPKRIFNKFYEIEECDKCEFGGYLKEEVTDEAVEELTSKVEEEMNDLTSE